MNPVPTKIGIEIEVVPVVAFAGPEQAAVFEPTAPDAVVVHELVGTLLDEGGELPGLGIHRQELVELMATLVVLHGDITAVGSPLEPVEGVLISERGEWRVERGERKVSSF